MIAPMDVKGIAAIDHQIRQLEKELSALYQKRVGLLAAELQRAHDRIQSLAGSLSADVTAAETSNRRAPGPKRGKPGRPAARNSRTKLVRPAKGIAPDQGGVEAAQALASPGTATSSPAKSKPVRGPKKRTRTPTAEVERRILDALKGAALFGMAQIELSKATGLGYQTVVKKVKELPGIEKKGSGKAARFYLKA